MVSGRPELLFLILLGLARIPPQGVRDRVASDAQRDHIGRIRRLFGVNDKAVVNRRVRCHHRVLGSEHVLLLLLRFNSTRAHRQHSCVQDGYAVTETTVAFEADRERIAHVPSKSNLLSEINVAVVRRRRE